jgi:TPR repeat protein
MNHLRCLVAFCLCTVPALAQSPSGLDDLTKNAGAGNAEAQFQLGHVYEDGKAVQQDMELAAVWYRKAADQGYAPAQNDLGVMYRNGSGVLKDKEEAARWFEKAAQQCNPHGAYNLGIAYYNGDGVISDPGLAYVWLLVAKQCGNPDVQSTLDLVARETTFKQRQIGESKFIPYLRQTPGFKPDVDQLLNQMGTSDPPLAYDICAAYASADAAWRDAAKAQTWCQRAVVGHYGPGAYVILGKLAEQRGDFAEAFKQYRELAQSVPSAVAGPLGGLYLAGKGTRQDPAAAYFWFYLAVHKYFLKKLQPQLDLAAQQISEKDRKKQEQKAADWLRDRSRGFPTPH